MASLEARQPTSESGGEALEAVFTAVRAGDIAKARVLANAALAKGLEHHLLLNLRALDLEDAGRHEDALADLRRAHALAPADFSILNACGLCLARMDRQDEALSCFDQALAIQPKFGPAWFNRASALERIGEKAKAAQSYAKAAELNPENAQAWANMGFLAVRRGDADSARKFADMALEAQPGLPTARLVLADIALAEPQAAERLLRAMLAEALSDYDRVLALGQLGDALDALDRPAEAFAAYTQSNVSFGAASAARFEAAGQANIVETLARMIAWAERLNPASWGSRTPATTKFANEGSHVFLLGFPRSGTTVMESVLANHPQIVTLEERNTLQAGVLNFLDDPRALADLETASGWALQPYRDDYWARVKQFGDDPSGKIFIDKNPFNTLKLPLIYRLFPKAKIIFAVRDPRDVVLSCFRRRFGLNASTYEFLDLKRTAANYDDTMRFATIIGGKQDLAEHRLVYERLMEDFAGETRALLAFLGAEWRDDLAQFAGRAQRGEVASASSAQIARGLYSEGVGQWRRYRTELAPVLETLAPWVEHFGYSPD